MATLILPCAGRSTRFPGTRPKWTLTHPCGDLMLLESIKGIDLTKYDQIVAVFIKEDLEKYKLTTGLQKAFKNLPIPVDIVELENKTKSQSETVATAIKKLKITGSILIKDCDGYFIGKYRDDNFVYTCDLKNAGSINASSKSYVDIDSNKFIKTIVEKDVISNLFCCGGYGFDSAVDFVKTYEKLQILTKDSLTEIYISHIIFQQILDGKQFNIEQASNFKDWGTIEDWNQYKKQYKTLFIDIDGVLVENSGEFIGKIWGTTNDIKKNKEYINKLYNTGKVRIILTTSRKSSYKCQTIDQLNLLDIKYHDIIFDLLHCQRIIINDFSDTNAYPTAKSINIPRNNNNLEQYLKENF